MTIRLILVTALVLVLIPRPAHAYLDPGTISMVLHGVVAAIAGALVTLRIYWAKTKEVWARWTRRDRNSGSHQP